MRKANRLLREMFITEITPLKHAETELNMGQSVAKSPRRFTSQTGKAQSDIDSAQSLVKKEAGEGGQGLRVTGDQVTMQALMDIVQYAASDNDEYAGWCDQAADALRQAVRSKSGTATLPQYVPDSFDNDDAGFGGQE